jgi:glyoxylase-like metal-dependent hydrolase (beta-lactamase superfamily II)
LLVQVPDVKLRAVTSDSLFAWRSLSPRVSLVGGNGANSVVIADGRDVLLVDTKETGFGGALRAEVEQVRRAPNHLRVTTHHHTDSVMGNGGRSESLRRIVLSARVTKSTVAEPLVNRNSVTEQMCSFPSRTP